MGEMALATLRGLDNGGLLDDDMYEPVVYYDLLGRFMFVMSFSTYQIFNILALVLVPLVPVVWTLRKEKDQRREYAAALKELVSDTVQGVLLVLTAFVVAMVTIGVACAVLFFINPMVSGPVHNLYPSSSDLSFVHRSPMVESIKLASTSLWRHSPV
jgi:hypothetical protein